MSNAISLPDSFVGGHALTVSNSVDSPWALKEGIRSTGDTLFFTGLIGEGLGGEWVGDAFAPNANVWDTTLTSVGNRESTIKLYISDFYVGSNQSAFTSSNTGIAWEIQPRSIHVGLAEIWSLEPVFVGTLQSRPVIDEAAKLQVEVRRIGSAGLSAFSSDRLRKAAERERTASPERDNTYSLGRLKSESLKTFLDFWSSVREWAKEPDIAVDPDGNIQAEWFNKPGHMLLLRFFDGGPLHVHLLDGLNAELSGMHKSDIIVKWLRESNKDSHPMTWGTDATASNVPA